MRAALPGRAEGPLGEWIVAIAGTETGRWLATGLALLAAVAHASLGALQKGRFDPWLSRGAIDLAAAAIAVPFLFVVPAPSPFVAALLAGAMVIHLAYKWVLAMAYSRGAFTAVYPVVRATGPLVTVAFAWIVFGERFTPGQWGGVLMLSGGILALAFVNLRDERIDAPRLRAALALALLTGITVALYTTWDAYAIRQSDDPFTFLVWFFLLDGILFPALVLASFRAEPDLTGLFRRGALGGFVAWVSFGSILLATRLDKVGEAAALRETSVVFAALIGWLGLGEAVGARRWLLMIVIAGGAVLVEFAG